MLASLFPAVVGSVQETQAGNRGLEGDERKRLQTFSQDTNPTGRKSCEGLETIPSVASGIRMSVLLPTRVLRTFAHQRGRAARRVFIPSAPPAAVADG